MIIPPRHRRELVSVPTPLAPRTAPSCSGWNCLSTGQRAGIIVGIVAFAVLLCILVSFLIANWLHKKDVEVRRLRRKQLRPRIGGGPSVMMLPPPRSMPIPLMLVGPPQIAHIPIQPPMVAQYSGAWSLAPHPYGSQPEQAQQPWWPPHYAVPGARAMPSTNPHQAPGFPPQISPEGYGGYGPTPSDQRYIPSMRAVAGSPPPPSEADNGQDDSDEVSRIETRRKYRRSHTRKRLNLRFFSSNRGREQDGRHPPEPDADSTDESYQSDEDGRDNREERDVPRRPPTPKYRESYPPELLTDRATRRAWNTFHTLPIGRVSTVASDAGPSRETSPTASAVSSEESDEYPPTRRRSYSERRRAERRASMSGERR